MPRGEHLLLRVTTLRHPAQLTAPTLRTLPPMHRLRFHFSWHRRRKLVAITLLLVLLAISTMQPFAHFASGTLEGDAEPSSALHSVITLDWFDASRNRDVPARLFWPNSAYEGNTPLVLFSHGIGSSDDGYTHLGKYWADHGIASLHVRHVGSDRSIWKGNLIQVVQQVVIATDDQEAVSRVADLRLALDSVLAGSFGTYIDRTRVVVAGHSYGANTAMLLAGARVERDGRILELGDSRIAAAILISAPPFYGASDLAPILGGISMPTLHVTTADDIIRLPGYGSGVEDRQRVFDAMGGDKTFSVFDRGSHNVFTDRRYFDTAAVADGVKSTTQRLTLAFLRQIGGPSGGRFAPLSDFHEPGLRVHSVEQMRTLSVNLPTQSIGLLVAPRHSAP